RSRVGIRRVRFCLRLSVACAESWARCAMGIDRQSPVVGILDSAELPVERHELYLSAAELHDSCAIHNPRRKEEWFAGRMAAKFVFLQGAHAGDSGQSAKLCVQSITARML